MSDESSGRKANRFVRPLPPNPNLEKQRKLAKALARDYWRGDPEAVERVRALHPKPPAPDDFALSDAQLVIARGYGFASWPQLKRKIDSLTKSPAELFVAAVQIGDVDQVRRLLQSHGDLVSRINEPMFGFKSPAVHVARTNLDLLDLLLAHGADLNARTRWEKGGFGVLEQVSPEQAAPLLAHGAEVDALDDDHDSTPAQHLIGEHPDVAAFLVARGARSDLLLAAALGDFNLVRRHLDADPGAIAMRVDQDWFPMIDTAPNGGHIYQWTLGFHVSAFDVARKCGHAA